MGNRAVITTPDKKIGVYLHWNGGRDSVEGFLQTCKKIRLSPAGTRQLRLGAPLPSHSQLLWAGRPECRYRPL